MQEREMNMAKQVKICIGRVILAILTLVLVLGNMLLSRYSSTITYYWNLDKQVSGDTNDAELMATNWQNAKDVTTETAEEGVTLLKNENNTLPMNFDKVNVFGYASASLVVGGAGSGSTSGAIYCESLKESFEAQGIEVNEDLWNYYQSVADGIDSGEWDVFAAGGTDFNFYDAACTDVSQYVDDAKSYSNTAIVVLSRVGGEGTDLPLDVEEEGCYGGDAGKHYLELQSCEEELLALVEDNFENVIVLINSSHAMELGFLEDERIDAALQIAGPGATGMQGVAEVLKGDVNPSGHLVDTYAYDLKSAPSFYNMGDCSYSDFELEMSDRYIYFEENIYTGYRWYETASAEGVVITVGDTTWDYSDYDSIVQYPFGYGLSYTSFDWSMDDYTVDGQGGNVTCTVTVTNTGDVAGKDVVQLYYSAPYIAGGVEKSAVNLGAFAKTDLIEPGESQTVELTMVFDDMASFDYSGEGCYIMDEGIYTFSLRTDAHTLKAEDSQFTYDLNRKIVYNDETDGARSTDLVAAVTQEEFEDAGSLETNVSYLSRADFAGTFPIEERRLNPTSIPSEVKDRLEANGPGSDILNEDDDSVAEPIVGVDNGLTISDLKGADYDDERWELLVQELTMDELIQMTGNSGWSTPAAASIGKADTVDIDGPQGLNGFNFTDTEMNTYASEVLMGMSWNTELANKMGSIYAKEALGWGISGLYAPAMNTHRSPFGARNFEYFSEDPTLAGLMAAAEVTGIQNEGVYVYAKHYLLNTQDSNRDGCANWCNEQALREVYARSFELAIKVGKCTGLMTELSRIGTSWSSATYALCTTMPREEWGFEGKIITDGVGPGGSYYMLPDYALRAGTDMMLTMASGDCGFTSATLESNYGITCMQKAAKNILYVYANSAAINNAVSGTATWTYIWIIGNIVLVLVMALIYFFMIYKSIGYKEDETIAGKILKAIVEAAIPAACGILVVGVVVLVLALTNVQILSWSIGYILTSGTNSTVIGPSITAVVGSLVVLIASTIYKKKSNI